MSIRRPPSGKADMWLLSVDHLGIGAPPLQDEARAPHKRKIGHGLSILDTTEDGRSQIKLRAHDQTVWLTQSAMAELFESHRLPWRLNS